MTPHQLVGDYRPLYRQLIKAYNDAHYLNEMSDHSRRQLFAALTLKACLILQQKNEGTTP